MSLLIQPFIITVGKDVKGKSNSEDTENLEAVWFIKHQSKVVLENPESLLGL